MNDLFDYTDPKWGHIKRGKELYSGKAKTLFETNDPNILIQRFNDDATAFNGKKKAVIEDKGICNNSSSSILFSHLHSNNISTHFITKLNDREMLVNRVNILPIEVVVRNVVAGSLSKRLDIEEGTPIVEPIIEYYYKSDELDDPMITEDHIRKLGLIRKVPTEKEYLPIYKCKVDIILFKIKNLTKLINIHIKEFFEKHGILLVDMKLEFGHRTEDQHLILADEISPDTCRLWDLKTNEKLDKDVFRRDLGDTKEVYAKIRRLFDLTYGLLQVYESKNDNDYTIRSETRDILDNELV